MKEFQYAIAKMKGKVRKKNSKFAIYNLFRKKGISIGINCNICSNIITTESYLIKIGDNVTISNGVQFITHDNSICKVIPNKTDIFGRIKIGNNSFIGARTIIMYGVTLADNIIVAVGSVVTKSFLESNIIIGGNPAKKISTWEKLENKVVKFAFNIDGLTYEEKRRRILKEETLILR